ncbi:MAG: hypothetical protein QGF30_02000, partial [Alphaproteobacteria bacterium]|nr:hypothetical protein [Alphaproteobacteria bacterium]
MFIEVTAVTLAEFFYKGLIWPFLAAVQPNEALFPRRGESRCMICGGHKKEAGKLSRPLVRKTSPCVRQTQNRLLLGS